MIYYQHRALFIHIPRTSGISVSKAVLNQSDPEFTGVNVVLGLGLGKFWRHSQAHVLQRELPEFKAPVLKKFTIVRSPWRICESTYRHFRFKDRQFSSKAASWVDPEVRDELRRYKEQSFEDFVLSHFQYLQGGFFAHWALEWDTLRDLGVKAFRFEDLDSDWPRICELLELPRETPRPEENASPPCETRWSEEAVDFIRRKCSLDLKLFAYPPHP